MMCETPEPRGQAIDTLRMKAVLVGIVLAGVSGASVSFGQEPSQLPAYIQRAASRTEADLRVSAAALSTEESEAVYKAPLADRHIQPVWIEVENKGESTYWLLSVGVDPNFFPPSEAAEAIVNDDSSRSLKKLNHRFQKLAFRNPIPPGAIVSGFVLTNLHEGVKLIQVDLFSDEDSESFSFVTVVPGLRADYEENEVFRREIHAPEEIVDYTDDASFVAALEALPCCVTNKNGSKNGDPLNLVIVGGVEDAFPALIRRGWSPTEVTWSGSVLRMVNSALARERYPYAPVSNLYLFGRPQDIAMQKARDNIHQRNHLRLWKSPMRYHGKSVWVGQISRDIGSRLTIHSPTLTTHKIDPDVDAAAEALLEDLVYSQGLTAFGFVGGVGAAPKDAPRQNLTTDPYYTKGGRAVLLFDDQPTSLTEITILPWRAGSAGFVDQVMDGQGQ